MDFSGLAEGKEVGIVSELCHVSDLKDICFGLL